MKDLCLRTLTLCLILILGWLWPGVEMPPARAAIANPGAPIYQERTIHHPDGIGKYYLGREIARVMGYEGAGWLERPTREIEEQPFLMVNALDLNPADIVADLGAGTGYFSFRLSSLVPEGKVLAVDIQPEMLAMIEQTKAERGINNIETLLASETDPHLAPASIDLALLVDAYHEFSYPYEVMRAVTRALKPGGRVVLVEYRGENPFVLIKPLHKMTQRQARREMARVGLRWRETKTVLPQQHLMIFEASEEAHPEGLQPLIPQDVE